MFIGMDQARDELLYSNVKGKNPFKDKRVREALYHAVDIEAIKKNTMRGLSQPSGGMLPSPLTTTPAIEKRLPYDKERAKKLLAEAGYANGFEVTLDCPNNRYVNDEKICQALAAMWAQIGVKVAVNAMPRATYFPKLEKTETSMYMLGWGGANTDGIFVLQPVLSTYNGKGDGGLQLRPVLQPEARRADGEDQDQHEGRGAVGRDPRRAARAQRRGQSHPAASAGDPVGDAQQRRRRASRRQQRHPLLGHDQVAGATIFAIQRGQDVRHFGADVRVLASRARRHVERVVGIVDELERGARAQPSGNARKERQVGELVARPLQEEHRNAHCREVDGTLVRRLTGWVQREPKERETAERPAAAMRLALARSSARRTISRRRRGRVPAPAAMLPRLRRGPSRARPSGNPGASTRAPCTETGSGASQCRASARSLANAVMNGCVMPAPAPCAIT